MVNLKSKFMKSNHWVRKNHSPWIGAMVISGLSLSLSSVDFSSLVYNRRGQEIQAGIEWFRYKSIGKVISLESRKEIKIIRQSLVAIGQYFQSFLIWFPIDMILIIESVHEILMVDDGWMLFLVSALNQGNLRNYCMLNITIQSCFTSSNIDERLEMKNE